MSKSAKGTGKENVHWEVDHAVENLLQGAEGRRMFIKDFSGTEHACRFVEAREELWVDIKDGIDPKTVDFGWSTPADKGCGLLTRIIRHETPDPRIVYFRNFGIFSLDIRQRENLIPKPVHLGGGGIAGIIVCKQLERMEVVLAVEGVEGAVVHGRPIASPCKVVDNNVKHQVLSDVVSFEATHRASRETIPCPGNAGHQKGLSDRLSCQKRSLLGKDRSASSHDRMQDLPSLFALALSLAISTPLTG